ncbi:MAG: SemiSWEET family sugar transporter [Candidatus Levyibacteriota bacterium]
MHESFTTWLGFAAAVIGAITYFPQLFRIVKTKHTKDISLPTYLMLDLVTFMWFVYAILTNDVPLILNGSLVFVCVMWITILKLRYG